MSFDKPRDPASDPERRLAALRRIKFVEMSQPSTKKSDNKLAVDLTKKPE